MSRIERREREAAAVAAAMLEGRSEGKEGKCGKGREASGQRSGGGKSD